MVVAARGVHDDRPGRAIERLLVAESDGVRMKGLQASRGVGVRERCKVMQVGRRPGSVILQDRVVMGSDEMGSIAEVHGTCSFRLELASHSLPVGVARGWFSLAMRQLKGRE